MAPKLHQMPVKSKMTMMIKMMTKMTMKSMKKQILVMMLAALAHPRKIVTPSNFPQNLLVW
jgi:hypothetical protein